MIDKCPNCGSNLFYNTAGQYCSVCRYTKPYHLCSNTTTSVIDNNVRVANHVDTPNTIKNINNHPQTLTVECNKITLHHKLLDIDIDISTNIDSFDCIVINGIKFKKAMDQ